MADSIYSNSQTGPHLKNEFLQQYAHLPELHRHHLWSQHCTAMVEQSLIGSSESGAAIEDNYVHASSFSAIEPHYRQPEAVSIFTGNNLVPFTYQFSTLPLEVETTRRVPQIWRLPRWREKAPAIRVQQQYRVVHHQVVHIQ
jgi:hypothetical protein